MVTCIYEAITIYKTGKGGFQIMNNEVVPGGKNIVLIGFMGVGKTTIGRLLAEKIERTFIDIDQEIESEYQMPITEIFSELGEKAFREKEKNAMKNYCKQKLMVLSFAGRAFMQEEIRETCLTNCIVLHLDTSWEAWKERLSLLVDSRPVLQEKTLEEIEALFHERKKLYKAHSKIVTDGLKEEDIADQVMASLEGEEISGSIF